jgi:hypothetical protein
MYVCCGHCYALSLNGFDLKFGLLDSKNSWSCNFGLREVPFPR